MADGTLKVGTITTSSGSGSITIPSGVSLLSNTPAFEAYLSASQDVSNNTHTKVQVDTEVLDTDGCFDNSTNYRFTPTTAGKYFVFCGLEMTSNVQSRLTYSQINLYKNGSSYQNGAFDMNDSYQENKVLLNQTAIVEMNGTTDYLEFYGRIEANSATPKFSHGTKTHFGAYRIGV